jgi:hypothetical protein
MEKIENSNRASEIYFFRAEHFVTLSLPPHPLCGCVGFGAHVGGDGAECRRDGYIDVCQLFADGIFVFVKVTWKKRESVTA